MLTSKLAPLSSLGIRIRFQPSLRNSSGYSRGLDTNIHSRKDPTGEAAKYEYGLPQSSAPTSPWKWQTKNNKTTDERGIHQQSQT